ncbi:hypothetical protein ACLB9X_32765 [Streptomyces sp. 5K101]|uniref:hypothetical protein n=1 Tax=Streptomyces sp. 5K101 TaxID=3390037 RepID=UPI003977138A
MSQAPRPGRRPPRRDRAPVEEILRRYGDGESAARLAAEWQQTLKQGRRGREMSLRVLLLDWLGGTAQDTDYAPEWPPGRQEDIDAFLATRPAL